MANRLGKRIVGVYTRGGTAADAPPALDDYESARVNWSPETIFIDAIEGKDIPFENPGGGERRPFTSPPKKSLVPRVQGLYLRREV